MSEDNILTMFNLPNTITAEYFDSVDCFSREGIWQLCYRDLHKVNFSIHDKSALSALSFNTQTVFPSDISQIANSVLNEGKENLLNTNVLYKNNITGANVKVAIIDRPINKNHIEIKEKIEYIEVLPNNEGNDHLDFHGMVCATFLCGTTCGIAKNAELSYFAIPNLYDTIDEYYNSQIKALEKIIEYNNHNASPIRLVSLSAPFSAPQMKIRAELILELSKQHCYVIDAKMFNSSFTGIDYDKYCKHHKYELNKWQVENYERNKIREGFSDYFYNQCIYVPSTRRTSACNFSDNSYIHWSKAVSGSWTIPHVVGAFALLLQSNPNISYNEFVQLAKTCPKQDGYIVFDIEHMYNQMMCAK